MCISAAIVAGGMLLSAGVSYVSSISRAKSNYALAKYEQDVSRKELRDQANLSRLEAIDSENARTREFQAVRSRMLAAVGAQGIGENITFFGGADLEQRKAFLKDVANIRLGLVADQAQTRTGIELAGVRQQVAKSNMKNEIVGATGQFIGDVANSFAFYTTYRGGKAA